MPIIGLINNLFEPNHSFPTLKPVLEQTNNIYLQITDNLSNLNQFMMRDDRTMKDKSETHCLFHING